MDWQRECAAIIPCLNEGRSIAGVVRAVRGHLPNVIVIDDGSKDDTIIIAQLAGAKVLAQGKNCGKGAALLRGWKYAHAAGFRWVLMLDGDGQHAAQEIPDFLRCAETTKAALVVGNRMREVAGMPFLRRQINRLMSHWISRLTGAKLPDSQCGYRLAHLPSLLRLDIPANRFEIESATLVAMLAAGKAVRFVPIRTIYNNHRSHINPLTDTWRWLRWRAAQRPPLRACNTTRVP